MIHFFTNYQVYFLMEQTVNFSQDEGQQLPEAGGQKQQGLPMGP